MQSFSQAVTRWGASAAETMANATNITVVFGGLSSAKDLADLERICGTRQARRHTIHRGGDRGGRTATHSWETTPVLRAGDIRTLPAGVALVLWGRLPPSWPASPCSATTATGKPSGPPEPNVNSPPPPPADQP